MTKPILKWAGGKRWFVGEFGSQMRDLVDKRGGRYYEPFLGGASMALHLGLSDMVLNDVEEELVNCYVGIRDDPDEVADYLKALIKMGADEDTYKIVRDTPGSMPSEIAARMIYLNALCFNGLYRKNRKGEFNVPFGDQKGQKKKYFPDLISIRAASVALAGAELHCCDFSRIVDRAEEGDVIYADPPYHKTFSSYTADVFTEKDHERLAESLYYARERGAEFFCHNSDTEKVRYWYDGWTEIIPLKESRRINSKITGRGAVGCVLVVGADDV